MEDAITKTIDEIKPHILWMRRKPDVTFTQYALSEISIQDLVDNERPSAKITVAIKKVPEGYTRIRRDNRNRISDSEYKFTNSIDDSYFLLKSTLQRKDLTASEKAAKLRNFQENVARNFSDPEFRAAATDLNTVLDSLYEELTDKSKNKKQSLYAVNFNILKYRDPGLEKAHAIHIIDLIPALFLDDTNFSKITAHDKYDKGIPCEVSVNRKIIYE